MEYVRGTTSLSIFLRAVDANGIAKTGLAWNTSGISASYVRNKASSATVITLATMTLGTWATGGFVEVDATKHPGLYALGVPDAALATGDGSTEVVIQLLLSGSYFPPTQIDLKAVNAQDAVRGGLTALPNANAGVSGGLPTIDSSLRVSANVTAMASGVIAAATFAANALDAVWSTAARTLTAFGFSVTVGTNNDKTGYTLSAAGIQAVWDALTTALTTAGSVGKLIKDNLDAAISSRSTYSGTDTAGTTTLLTRIPGTVQPQTGDSYARLGAPAGVSVAADIAAVAASIATLLTNVAAVPAAVWAAGTRTLTGFGTLVADIWAGVTQAFFAKFFTQDSGQTYADAVDGSVVKEIAGNATTDPTSVAAAVWNRLTSALTTPSSIGKLLVDNIDTTLSSIKARIAPTGNTFNSHVARDLTTTLYYNRDLNSDDGLSLIYPVNVTLDEDTDTVAWNATCFDGTTHTITGSVLTDESIEVEVTADDAKAILDIDGTANNIDFDTTFEAVITRSGRQIESVQAALLMRKVVKP